MSAEETFGKVFGFGATALFAAVAAPIRGVGAVGHTLVEIADGKSPEEAVRTAGTAFGKSMNEMCDTVHASTCEFGERNTKEIVGAVILGTAAAVSSKCDGESKLNTALNVAKGANAGSNIASNFGRSAE